MVSCHEPNVSLIRNACTAEIGSHTFTALGSVREVHEFARAAFDGGDVRRPHVLLLDLDTAPEPSWWCAELLAARSDASEVMVIGLSEASLQAPTQTRLGDVVSAVMPMAHTACQAQSLVRVVAASRLDRSAS